MFHNFKRYEDGRLGLPCDLVHIGILKENFQQKQLFLL
jgi:hypothetical protein